MADKIRKYTDLDNKLRIKPDGNVVVLRGSDVIKQSIKTILSTLPGERVMLPNFGGSIRDFLFEPMDPETAEDIKDRIETSLEDEEPRISVKRVQVIPDYSNQLYRISVQYRNNISNERDEFTGVVRTLSDL